MSSEALDPGLLREAATWLMRLHAGELDAAEQETWQRWRHRSDAHEIAWQRAQRLADKLGAVPAAIGRPTLERLPDNDRRAALKTLAVAAGALPAAWLGWRASPWAEVTADHRTATGQRREWRLADGSRLVLNTASAVDVHFDDALRLLRLRAGELYVATAPDPAAAPRPFVVETAQGRIRALGTRFAVRQFDGESRVTVTEGAVEVRPRAGAPVVLPAGGEMRFDAGRTLAAVPQRSASTGWLDGVFYADDLALGEVIAELARYRPGLLRCESAVAGLRVSGAFQLDQPERALALLAQTLPVRIERRTRYWVTVAAAAPG